jgi:hypothetical protein
MGVDNERAYDTDPTRTDSNGPTSRSRNYAKGGRDASMTEGPLSGPGRKRLQDPKPEIEVLV